MKKLFFISVLAILGLSANAQWVQTNLNSGSIICFAIKGDTIFAGTYLNGMYFSTNNGSSWSSMNTGTSLDINVMALAINGNNIIAGTKGYGLFLSSDNGNSWSAVNNGFGWDSTFACWDNVTKLAMKGDTIFAGTGNGVYLSSNNAGSWSHVNTGPINTCVTALAVKGGTIFAGCSGAFWSSNDGSNWTLLTSTSLINTLAISGNNIFAGTWGGVFLSSDTGNSWTAVNTGLPTNNVIWALAIKGDSIFAGTYVDGVYLSTNNGSSWTAVNDGLTGSGLYSNEFTIKGDILFSGTYGAGVWILPLSKITEIEKINNNESNMAVYPNPASNNITIEAPQQAEIEITNIQGQLIKTLAANSNKTNIDVSAFPNGIYFVKVKMGKRVVVEKFVKE